MPASADPSLLISILALASYIGLILVVLRWLVCPPLGRTLLVALLFEGYLAVYTVGFLFAVSSTLLHCYTTTTGSMAETLRGYISGWAITARRAEIVALVVRFRTASCWEEPFSCTIPGRELGRSINGGRE